MKHFKKVLHGGYPFSAYKTVEQELQFFKQWFLSVFEELGIVEDVEEKADFFSKSSVVY